MDSKNKKVIVAMSGGVDSAVAALLLKNQGYDISGVYFELFGQPGSDWEMVKKIAKQISIKVEKINLQKEFKQEVIDYFCQSYFLGDTPNPCVFCNHQIKFGLFWQWAKKQKADFIATGHYVRLRREIRNPKCEIRKNIQNKNSQKEVYKLLKGKDKSKDQSYFLYRLTQNDLSHTLFPLGNLTKKEVIKIAKKNKLANANKSSSQDVCFLKGINLKDFLKGNIKNKIKKGDILEIETGKKKGKHNGLLFYTIGQRGGIGFSGGPWYVAGKDKEKNTLFVTKNKKQLEKDEILFSNTNWILEVSQKSFKAKTQIRYQGGISDASVYNLGKGKFKAKLKKPQYAVAPGQSIVFYNGQEVLGGGIISK